VTFATGDRVRIKPLDGIAGTIMRVREDGQYSVLADCAAQQVVWAGDQLEPA
jgi:hypothetical protein